MKLLTEGLRSELMDTNVTVTVVFPGAVATNIAAHSGVTIEQESESQSFKVMSPQEAAQIIIDGIERDRYRILVGSDVTFMDRIYRLSPQRAAKLIYSRMRSLLPE